MPNLNEHLLVSENNQKKGESNDKNRNYMLESFDGGQTLRHDYNDEQQESAEDVTFKNVDKPVSINSSIEIISKKKPQRDNHGIESQRSPIDVSNFDK